MLKTTISIVYKALYDDEVMREVREFLKHLEREGWIKPVKHEDIKTNAHNL